MEEFEKSRAPARPLWASSRTPFSPGKVHAMDRAKIGFVLLSNSRKPIPSTRVAVLNLLPLLRSAGLDAQVLFDPESEAEQPRLSHDLLERIEQERFDAIIFQKVHGPEVLRLVQALKARRIVTVYLVCDLVDEAMADATDATVVVTDFLRELYPQGVRHKVHVVHDGIEHPDVRKRSWRADCGSRSRPLNAVLVTSSALSALPQIGSPPDWLRVTLVGRYPPRRHWRRRFDQARWTCIQQQGWSGKLKYLGHLFDPGIQREAWHPQGVYEHLRAAAIGIIPIDDSNASPAKGNRVPLWMVKSDNRLTLKMAVGLPVIATPIPAYERVIEQGVNGFLARSPADWRRFLEELRDPQRRRSMGEQARASVLDRFSMEAQARRLMAVLEGLLALPEGPSAGPSSHTPEGGHGMELPVVDLAEGQRASHRKTQGTA